MTAGAEPVEDPFGTAQLRRRVLDAWAASPDRFREDANAEEDLVHGGYRDRLLVELAQNAADAAARAGVRGRLLLRLADAGEDGPVLLAASSGAPLDAAGVRALASLRASAKASPAGATAAPGTGAPGEEAGSVGRFGVGFAAVLAVTDEPVLVSRAGGVRFSRVETRELVEAAAARAPGLGAELSRRAGHVPALRLPFPAPGVLLEHHVGPDGEDDGHDTVVLLPLRDDAAVDLVERLLDGLDDTLLVALPGLAEVVVERPGRPPRRLSDVQSRWHLLRRTGRLDPALLADRPTEDRARTGWALTWALPRVDATGDVAPLVPRVLHAPTPTDEPLDWPALLVATFPLGPDRRRPAPGPAADALVERAADAYVDLLVERAAAGDDVVPLVPTGLAAGPVDAALRRAVLHRLPGAPVLAAVEDGTPVRPRDAVAIAGDAGDDPDVLAVLAPVLAGLVAAPRRHAAALRAAGVEPVPLADVVESLPADRDPAAWRRRYAGLAGAGASPEGREALAALPVPLADGRVVRGVRGLLLPSDGAPAAALALLAGHGARVVHPGAAHPLLERLGAEPASPRALLDHPAAATAVADLVAAAEEGEPPDQAAVDAVLELVDAAVSGGRLGPGELPWLAELPLPDEDGEPAPAGSLVLPGSLAAEVVDDDELAPVAADVAARWPEPVLTAVGVVTGLTVVTARDVDLDALPEVLEDVTGVADWAQAHGPGTAAAVRVLRDVDLVADDAWPRALAVLARDPAAREALVEPVVVVRDGAAGDGRPDHGPAGAERVPGPTARWLRWHLATAGRLDPAAGEAGPAGVLPAGPSWAGRLDAPVRRALGLVRRWEDLDADGWQVALDALADPGRPVGVEALLGAWAALGVAPVAPGDVDPPGEVRGLRGGPPVEVVLVEAGRAVVVDAPMWAQRADLGAQVLPPAGTAEAVADLLDLDLASERAAGRPAAGGEVTDVGTPPGLALVLPDAPARWLRCSALTVDGAAVGWWVRGDGRDAEVLATSAAGAARGLAQAAGAWGRRLIVEQVLAAAEDGPDRARTALVEEALGPAAC